MRHNVDRRRIADRRKDKGYQLTHDEFNRLMLTIEQDVEIKKELKNEIQSMSARIGNLEKYIFAGRVVFWVFTSFGVFIAYLFDLGNSAKTFFHKMIDHK